MLHVILRPPFDEPELVPIERTEQGVNNQCVCVHFEIGQSTSAVPIDLVESVWADGAELKLIQKHFEGLPLRFDRHPDHDQTMKWFGDHAKFIVANWT